MSPEGIKKWGPGCKAKQGCAAAKRERNGNFAFLRMEHFYVAHEQVPAFTLIFTIFIIQETA